MIAAEKMTGSREWGYFTLISPVFITALLLLISGIPLLETSAHKKYKNDPTYINYLNETSILVIYIINIVRYFYIFLIFLIFTKLDSDAKFYLQSFAFIYKR